MDCVICLNPIKNKYTLDCSHSFCFKCINKWLKTPRIRYGQVIGYNNCPICRTSSQIDPTKIRLTRSLTIDKRRTSISNELFKDVPVIDSTPYLIKKAEIELLKDNFIYDLKDTHLNVLGNKYLSEFFLEIIEK